MRNEAEDLKKLADAFFSELTMLEWEYGGIGLDPKRPFGNSDVEGDILELLDWEPEGDDGGGPCYSSTQRDYVAGLYREKLIPYLREQWARLTPNVEFSGGAPLHGAASAGTQGSTSTEET